MYEIGPKEEAYKWKCRWLYHYQNSYIESENLSAVQEYTTMMYLIKSFSIQVDYWKLQCHLVPLKIHNYFW